MIQDLSPLRSYAELFFYFFNRTLASDVNAFAALTFTDTVSACQRLIYTSLVSISEFVIGLNVKQVQQRVVINQRLSLPKPLDFIASTERSFGEM